AEILIFFVIGFLLWRIAKRDFDWRNMPFVGMFPILYQKLNRIHDACVEVLELFGGTFLLKGPWFVNLDILATVDPENVHFIMSQNFNNFPKGTEFKKIFDVLGDGIFNSDGEAWRVQRKQARALIAHERFRRFLVETNAGKLEKGLIPILERAAGNGGALDLQDVFQRFTFDTTCMLITGYDPGCLSVDLPDVPFSAAMDTAEEAIFIRHILPETLWKIGRFLRIGYEQRLKRAHGVLDRVIGDYIAMKKSELSDPTRKNSDDLLTSYISESDVTDKFLRDTVLNLMIAGRDTTSSALTWFIWLVSSHPDVESKILTELASLPNPPAGSPAAACRLFKPEELHNLVYLHCALCESLRLYPPVPFQHKSPAAPAVLPSGHYVHPKMKVLFSLYAMARMAYIWGEDCKEFRPERWINGRGKVNYEPSYKFMAFNAGPRTCIGKEVAFTQLKAVAAAVIYNYRVELVEGHDVSPNVSVILYMKHGFKVRVTKRL
ncbi:hypothetical protein M569_01963, partial [Genlisea aurea]